jgi:hypothetical protein
LKVAQFLALQTTRWLNKPKLWMEQHHALQNWRRSNGDLY